MNETVQPQAIDPAELLEVVTSYLKAHMAGRDRCGFGSGHGVL